MLSKAAQTRLSILQAAFALVYRQGYQATSIDDILRQMKITKGAFFYHFASKDDMGLAMIREVLYPGMHAVLVQPLLQAGDPLAELYTMMNQLLMEDPLFDVRYGCPAVNLVDEMAPVNEAFREELGLLVGQWERAIVQCLKKGQATGLVATSVSSQQVAVFVITGYSGIRNLGKVMGKKCYRSYLGEYKKYLDSLR